MTTDDPFGLNDLGRTQVIRPRPGGIGPAPTAAERAAPVASGAPLPEGTPGRGPLVQAAHGLLLLAPRLQSANPPRRSRRAAAARRGRAEALRAARAGAGRRPAPGRGRQL